MLKIAVCQKTANNAVWWYRVLPWQYLGRQLRDKIDVRVVSNQNIFAFESMISTFDVFVIHCPSLRRDHDSMMKARKLGLHVVADYDDLITDVPGVNEASQHYGKDDVKEMVLECYKLANFVTVSTQGLATEFEKSFGKRPMVIDNAWNDFVLPFKPIHNLPQNGVSTILWRGSNTHAGDLMRFRAALSERENLDWHFWGANPELIISEKYGGLMKTWAYKPWNSDITDYFAAIRNMKPNFFFVPLVDDTFNQCKSRIALYEAAYSGAVCLASNLPEFKDAFTFTDVNDLDNVLDMINENAFDFSDYFTRARSIIQENFLLSSINALRAEALEKTLSYE